MTDAEAIFEELVQYQVIDVARMVEDRNLDHIRDDPKISGNLIRKLERSSAFQKRIDAFEKVERGRQKKAEREARKTEVREAVMKDVKESIAAMSSAEIREARKLLAGREREAKAEEKKARETARIEAQVAALQAKLAKLKGGTP